ERAALQRQRGLGEAALDVRVVEVTGDVGVARAAVARVTGCAHGAGSSRVSAALATSPMRTRNSVPMSALERVASGDARISMPNAPGWLSWRSAISAIESARAGSSSHCTASKPVLTPQYGAARLAAKLCASAPTGRANGRPAKTSA